MKTIREIKISLEGKETKFLTDATEETVNSFSVTSIEDLKKNLIEAGYKYFTMIDIVKDNTVRFHSYDSSKDLFSYSVKLKDNSVFTFSIDRLDVGNATLAFEDKALIFMRWISKSINKGLFNELIEFNKYSDNTFEYIKNKVEEKFNFSFYRSGFIYYKGIVDNKEVEISIDITEIKEMRTFNFTENYSTLQQWIQQAQSQQQQAQSED